MKTGKIIINSDMELFEEEIVIEEIDGLNYRVKKLNKITPIDDVSDKSDKVKKLSNILNTKKIKDKYQAKLDKTKKVK